MAVFFTATLAGFAVYSMIKNVYKYKYHIINVNILQKF